MIQDDLNSETRIPVILTTNLCSVTAWMQIVPVEDGFTMTFEPAALPEDVKPLQEVRVDSNIYYAQPNSQKWLDTFQPKD